MQREQTKPRNVFPVLNESLNKQTNKNWGSRKHYYIVEVKNTSLAQSYAKVYNCTSKKATDSHLLDCLWANRLV